MCIQTMLLRASLALTAFALSVSPTIAGGVRIVDPSGQRNFQDIQSAVNAAVDGDVLLVGAGTYPAFTIDGKELFLFAVPSGSSGVQIAGIVEVRNLVDKIAIVSGLSAQGLVVGSCSGYVAIQDSTFTGPASGLGTVGGSIFVSARVVLVGCTLRAGNGTQVVTTGSVPGKPGVDLQRASVAAYDTSFVGGKAPPRLDDDAAQGGSGIRINGLPQLQSRFFASKCSAAGGPGGDAVGSFPGFGGNGGPGVDIESGAVAHLLDVAAQGGPPGLPFGGSSGAPIENSGLLDALPGAGRRFDLAAITSDRDPWILSVAGVSGDQIFLNRSLEPVFEYEPALSGVCTSVLPPFAPVAAAGVLPTSGSATFTLRQRLLPDGLLARVYFLQGHVLESGGATVLGSPRHVLSLNWNELPDCNANGIQDYAEVIAGITPDADHDLIPDDCP